MEYTIDQSSRLELAGILSAGFPEVAESEPVNPWPPLSRAALCGNVPRVPRQYMPPDEDEGETAPELVGENLEDWEAPEKRRGLPRDRGSVMRELRAMGFTWGE